ncbi:hypothetical protein [Robinsoniella peoriensis]|uniref:hypothetical protein n=1 Tax=Robinsoniella peoriensis TaxID=180332 RepID=UPI00362706A8
MSTKNPEDFEVIISTERDEEATIVTSFSDLSEKWISEAFNSYDPTNQKYSAYLKDGSSPSNKITPEELDELAENVQNDLKKVHTINSIIRKQINKSDIIGKTVECIDTNINTEVKLDYTNTMNTGRNKAKQLDAAKQFINNFNNVIKLPKLIRNSVTTSFAEGNYIMYLRHENNKYKVDYYPLGVCEISDYEVNGDPVILFNVQELRSRLQKTYKKTKKNKFLFFSTIEEEVKANYPKEVYDAFISKEQYAKLDIRYSGVIRLGNLNRKYGLSPIFRALEPLSMLDTFDTADRVNSKAKAKKIIHQKLRKEVMGSDLNKKGFEEMVYAHQNLMSAWKQPTVVVTTPPTVESILYVEPKIELTNIDTVNNYRSRVLATLGIGFLMDSSSQSVSTASISVTQLLRTINKISEQLEDIIQKWYLQILSDNNINTDYSPIIKIIDSESLDFALRKELATTLYTIFNGSLQSSLEILGMDINDETVKRKRENELNLETEVFYPRGTSYTSTGNNVENKSGRPVNKQATNKTEYDKTYNKDAR